MTNRGFVLQFCPFGLIRVLQLLMPCMELLLLLPQNLSLLPLQVSHLRRHLLHKSSDLGEHVWLRLGRLEGWKLHRKLVLRNERQLLLQLCCSLLMGELQRSQEGSSQARLLWSSGKCRASKVRLWQYLGELHR